MNLEDKLNCFGFHGFGAGWMLGTKGPEPLPDGLGVPMYCSEDCSKRDACWDAHRARVQRVMPDLCKHFDRVARRFGGGKAVALFVKKYKVADPYMMSFAVNLQAATFYANKMPLPAKLASGNICPKFPFETAQ